MKNYSKYFVIVLFSIWFWIPRAFFYLNYKIAGIQGDSFSYFKIAHAFKVGKIPDLGIIPPLYPMYLWIMGEINNSIDFIIFGQSLLSYISYVFLITVLFTLRNEKITNRIIHLILILTVSLVSWDSILLISETYIMTESIYYSFLLIYLSLVIYLLIKPSKNIFISFSLITFLLAFTRSNGIIFYPIWLMYLVYLFLYKKEYIKQFLYYAGGLFVFLNLLWSTLNYYSTQTFFFGNPYRMKTTTSKNILNSEEFDNSVVSSKNENLIYEYNKHNISYIDDDYSKNIRDKKGRIINYFFDINEPRRSFFSFTIPARFEGYYKEKKFSDMDFYSFKNFGIENPIEMRKYVTKEYFIPSLNMEDNIKELETSFFVTKIYNSYNYIYNIIFRNILWQVLSVISCIIVLYQISVKRIINQQIFIILIFVIVLYLNLFVVSLFHSRLVSRYQYVYILYNLFIPFFTLNFLIKGNKSNRNQ